MAKASTPPTSAVIRPTSIVFQIERMVSGLSNRLLEMHQRVLAHVEQAGGVADEQELAERRDDQRQRRQHHDDEQIDHRRGRA